MDILESFRLALGGLAANKMRSALTMLGVIIGVSAVILLVSVAQGAKAYVTGEIQKLGSNLVMVIPGEVEFEHGGTQRAPTVQNKLTLEILRAVEEESSLAKNVTAIVQTTKVVKFGNRTRTTLVNGVTASYPDVLNAPVEGGQFFSESQVSGSKGVCTLGKTVVDDLFGDTDPIGERITIAGRKFTVLGVMEEKGQLMRIDQDDLVYIPITTAQILSDVDTIDSIMVEARDAESIDETVSEVEKIIGKRLDGEDFSVVSQGEMLEVLEEVMGTLTLMLGGIASISLLVGGIGIMNIMLVSVIERTREIGIRKAVGAKTYDISTQFIIEATTLSLIGGTVGIILGILGSLVARNFLPSQITAWSVILAFFFAAAVGIFFGVYPAYKASRLDPIEALRYE
ncbi:MAG TPA: hypothetical protein DCW86_02810 [Actinobacteria bacterium]|nr:hypothetical protein [Actinomycetota bacterium]